MNFISRDMVQLKLMPSSELSEAMYVPLNDSVDEIRYILLHQGGFTSSIHCDIFHRNLEDNDEYEALSYTWGDASDTLPIQIGSHTLNITKNLHIALQHLRLGDKPRKLWVDAICINQKDIPERNLQVPKMRRIYENAKAVISWLGLPDENTHLAFELVERLGARGMGEDIIVSALTNPKESANWKALLDLCGREYWQRVWVNQEVVSASQVSLQCGSRNMSWMDLGKLARVVGDHFGIALQNSALYDGGLTKLMNPSKLRSLQVMKEEGKRAPLHLLILATRSHHCSDPRDKVYGMVGIARECQEHSFPIDYSLSVGEVYLRATRWMIEHSKKLDVITATYPQKPEHNLPSWAPDWTVSRLQNHLNEGYGAAGSSLSDAEFSEDGRVLTTTGCFLGNVDALGTPFFELYPEARFSAQMKEVINGWLQVAQLGSSPVPYGKFSTTWEEERIEAFWRTLILNKVQGPDKLEPERPRKIFDVARGAAQIPDDYRAPGLNKDRFQDYVAPLATNLTNSIFNRRFFTSGHVIMGLGPAAVEKGDEAWILQGCDRPVILRREGERFKLVGEAYVHRFMNGEAFNYLSDGVLRLAKVSIH